MLRNILAAFVAGTVVIGGAGFMIFGFYYWGVGFAVGGIFGMGVFWLFLRVHYGVDIGQMIDNPDAYWLVRSDGIQERRPSDAPIDSARPERRRGRGNRL